MLLLAFTGVTMAQVVEDFESLKMNIMLGGTTENPDDSYFKVIPNPDPTGINTSTNVVEFFRDKDGVAWGGFYATLGSAIDLTANKYVHVKVWKTRISPVKFKLEGSTTLEIESMNPQTLTNQWEEMVFDFTALTGEYTKIVFMPDFENPLTLTEDITIYFDDITINNDATVGSDPVTVMEDYEHIPLNVMLGGTAENPDESSMTIAENPDKSGINLSDHVIKFVRDKDGLIWSGFWSSLPTPVDVTDNKYVHVKVYKPRTSIVKFKLEGGTAGTLEIPSVNEQTEINTWVDMVFDFSEKTGTYPIIALLPDFSDPVDLTEDITIYFDDILVSNDPNPITPPVQKLNVDMKGSGMGDGEPVYLSGALGGIYGTWNEPGTNENNLMTDDDGDSIYSITLALPDGVIAFKFFWGTGWGNGDTAPGGDRSFTVDGSFDKLYKWGVDGEFVASAPNTLADNVKMYPNPVREELHIESATEISVVSIYSVTGQIVARYQKNTSGRMTVSTADLRSGVYMVSMEAADGSKLIRKLVRE